MAESPQRDVTAWLQRWRERLGDGVRMPEDEARLVIESVLEDLRGGHPENLDRAGRAWGRAHRSVSEMVGRLSSFREALAASGVDDPLRMHRALDRVTAAATEEVLHRLERASRTDALTGVGNRRAFDETLSAALSAAARQGHQVTVVAVDLDGLKRINDTEGHAAGDAALLDIVRAFYSALRDEDTVFRVGGDEFVILLPFTSVDTAALLMERIRASGAPSFTWGAAGFPTDGADARALVEAADQELLDRRRQTGRPRRLAPVAAVLAAPEPEVVHDRGAPEAATAHGRPRAASVLRWAWLPAAAVLLVSLIATLVSATSGPSSVSAGRHHQSPTTSPAHGGSQSGQAPATTVPGGPGGGGASSATTASGGAQATTVGLSSPPGSPNPPSPSPAPTPSPGPSPSPSPAPPPGQGGVLGLLENVTSPIPVVGGSNGLLGLVGQVLVGTPPTITSAGSGPVALAAQPSGTSSPAGSAASGLLSVVDHLLG